MKREGRGDSALSRDWRSIAAPEKKAPYIIAATLATALLDFDNKALAHIECTHFQPGKEFTLLYTREEDEKKYNLRFTTLDNFGATLTSKKIEDPFLEEIRRKDSQTEGVNYWILNQSAFDKFIQTDSLRSRDRLGLSWSSMQEMKPRDVLLMAAEITDWNTRNQPRIDPKNKDFNPLLFFKINFTPLDLLDEGVCRHFSSRSKVIARKLIEFSNSPYLQNLAVDEVVADNHSWDIFYEFTLSGGIPTVHMVFYDPFYPAGKAPHHISAQTLEAFIPPYQSVLATISGKFSGHFTAEERREALRHIFRLQERGEPNFTILQDYLLLTKNIIEDHQKKNQEDAVWKVFLDTDEFISDLILRKILTQSSHATESLMEIYTSLLSSEKSSIRRKILQEKIKTLQMR